MFVVNDDVFVVNDDVFVVNDDVFVVNNDVFVVNDDDDDVAADDGSCGPPGSVLHHLGAGSPGADAVCNDLHLDHALPDLGVSCPGSSSHVCLDSVVQDCPQTSVLIVLSRIVLRRLS